jgi:glycosyltransferase involved in cell wall biosynthesis
MITTIIPTYNRAHLLPTSINSILNQTYKDFVVCICDNHSTDDTEAVVRQFMQRDSRVRYIKQPENIGLMQNFIFGVSTVETPYFNLLSDDDTVQETFFEDAMKQFEANSELAFFAGAIEHCDGEGKVFGNPVQNWDFTGVVQPPHGFSEMIKKGHPDWTGIVFRTSVLKDVYPDINVGHAADYDFELRIAAKFPIYISKKVVARFVLHSGSESFKANLYGMWPAWRYLIKNIEGNQSLDQQTRNEVAAIFRKRITGRIFRCGLKSIVQKNYDQTLQAAKILEEELDQNMKARALKIGASASKRVRPSVFLLKGFILAGRMYRRRTGQYKF